MGGKNLKLTTVKIHEDLSENFKLDNIKTNFSLQKLCNRAIHLYLTDENFKHVILNHSVLAASGSL